MFLPKLFVKLLEHKANFCMDEVEIAYMLCEAVYENDIVYIRRLIRANINVNASDYDKRTALHVAACQGSTSIFKILVKHGADVTACDRWNHSILDEAARHNASQILKIISDLKSNDKIYDEISP